MKYMFYIMSFVSAWFACTVPAAVGFYWIISSITGFLQTVIINHWYSMDDLNGQAEARRIALREQEEAVLKPMQAQKRLPVDGKKQNGKK